MMGFSVNCSAPSARAALVALFRAAAKLSHECGFWMNGAAGSEQFEYVAERLEKRNAELDVDLAGVDLVEDRAARIEEDAEDYQGAFSHGWRPEADEAGEALAVLVLTPHIRAYLEAVDPNALAQARSALRLASQSPAETLWRQKQTETKEQVTE